MITHDEVLAVGAAPVIEIVSPDTSKPITPPISVDLRFIASPDAEIDPTTFRVHYGWFDITDRIKANNAIITTFGIRAKITSLGRGKYSLVAQIADTLGRVGKYTIAFEVA